VTAELEAELDRAEAEAALAGWDEEEDAELPQDEEQLAEQPEDPNAAKRFWFEHATGAGKTVAALGFVEASRTGGVLILTHRRNLVDQFNGELRDRGYKKRITPPLLAGEDRANGPVTVETYQWFVRNAGNISSAYAIVICDEAHTALGEKTSAAIRAWTGPVFIGMTATGALIARHVTDLFPTQTSRFDLAQAARRGVIAPLRCVRIPPGPGVRTIAKVPLRRGEVDTEFDQEMLAELLDQTPFNVAVANLYKTRFNGVPGVVYAAGVRHAYNLAEAFRAEGLKAQAVSGETPKRELASILARYERGDIDVLINAQLLAEGWNSPRATVCIHLAPTASKRIYQQRVGRVTRRHPGKEAGLVVDFVHPATKHDDPVVTLHSLLDRDVYRGGAIVVGPVRRGRGRRVRVERRVLPVCAEPERRAEVFERELWRIAVEHLDYGEQHVWAALAGARVQASGWRRARAMLHFDRDGELRRRFLITAVQRNKNPQLRLKALAEIAARAIPTRSTRRSTSSAPGCARSVARARRSCSRRWSTSESAAATRRTPGSGGSPNTPATCTRSTRCSAGRRPSACSACSSTPPAPPTRATPAASCTRRASRTAASPLRCSPPHSRTRRRPRRCCAPRARAWRASRPRSRASWLRNFPKRRGRGKRRRSRRGAGGAAGTAPIRRSTERRPTAGAAAASHQLLANGSAERKTRRPSSERRAGAAGLIAGVRRRELGGRFQMHLARVQRAHRPAGIDEQLACVVDAARDALTVGPGHLRVRQRVAAAPRVQYLALRAAEPAVEVLEQPLQERLDGADVEAQGARGLAQLPRQLGERHRDVDPDPEHRPGLARA
jgi:ribonuclease E